MDIQALFENDSQEVRAPQQEDLGTISNLANRMIEKAQQVEQTEHYLKGLKEEYRKIEQEDLPEAILQTGLSSMTLDSGQKIIVKNELTANIKKADEVAAFTWIRNQGHGALIKHELSAKFGKGEEETAQQLRYFLEENSFNFNDKETIHWATLRKFAKEMLEQGADLPEEISLFEYKKAVIK